MRELVFSSAFQRQLKKIVGQNPKHKSKISKTLKILIKNISHPSLRLHKLSGKNNWSVSVAPNLRIIVHLEGKRIYCLRIGTHDQVY